MSDNQTKRLDVLYVASKFQHLAKPLKKQGKTLSYIYYNVVLKNDDLVPVTRSRFYRYMRIDTSNYEQLRAEFIARQLEKVECECRQRNKMRRAAKRKALFGASAALAADGAAAVAVEAFAAEAAGCIPELVEQF